MTEAAALQCASPVQFTKREREVLPLLLDGLTTREIAQQLGITFKAAATRRTHILRRANVKNTVQLLKYAIQCGMIEP
jgi:DNA-binding CsgD family transcriptional regulator